METQPGIVKYFEWLESKPFGSQIGTPGSEHVLIGIEGGYCALGHYGHDNGKNWATMHELYADLNTWVPGGGDTDWWSVVADAFNGHKASTREDFMNLLAPHLPEEYRIRLPETSEKVSPEAERVEAAPMGVDGVSYTEGWAENPCRG